MAKRTSVVRHDTEEVQGEGSYVVLSALKVDEIRLLRQKGKAADKAEKAGKEIEGDVFEDGLEMLSTHILEWDWVNDEGEPLPLPKDDPEVIGGLTNDEAELLSALLTGDMEAKN